MLQDDSIGIFLLHILPFGKRVFILAHDPTYEDRVLTNVFGEGFNITDVFVTLTDVDVTDAGTYLAEMKYSNVQKCFTLYILGESHLYLIILLHLRQL